MNKDLISLFEAGEYDSLLDECELFEFEFHRHRVPYSYWFGNIKGNETKQLMLPDEVFLYLGVGAKLFIYRENNKETVLRFAGNEALFAEALMYSRNFDNILDGILDGYRPIIL